MARAKVRTIVAYRLTQHGHNFRKCSDTIITDEQLIARLKIDPQFRVVDITVAEMAKEPEDDFLKPAPAAPPAEEYKYHKLIAMRNEELQGIAYAMGARFEEDAQKKVIKLRKQDDGF